MAELLLQWTDKVPPQDPLYDMNYKGGDVISVCPNGWTWSPREQTNPAWRIVKLPNITVAEVKNMTAPAGGEGLPPTKKRAAFINGTQIPNNIFNQIDRNRVTTFQITYAQLQAWIAQHS